MRYIELKDLFDVICKKCGSTDVDLTADSCPDCGDSVSANCNKCGTEYKYHDFKKIES